MKRSTLSGVLTFVLCAVGLAACTGGGSDRGGGPVVTPPPGTSLTPPSGSIACTFRALDDGPIGLCFVRSEADRAARGLGNSCPSEETRVSRCPNGAVDVCTHPNYYFFGYSRDGSPRYSRREPCEDNGGTWTVLSGSPTPTPTPTPTPSGYTAVAFGTSGTAWAWAFDNGNSASAAGSAAISACQNILGSSCSIRLRAYNTGCAAVARSEAPSGGRPAFGWSLRSTRNAAQAEAIAQCERAASFSRGTCRVATGRSGQPGTVCR